MNRSGTPIERAWLSEPVHSGISYRVRYPGLVAEYEEYEAMKTANWNEAEWEALAQDAKARAVASYRLGRLVAAHEADAQAQHAKRAARRTRR